jgi:hypothetical protein
MKTDFKTIRTIIVILILIVLTSQMNYAQNAKDTALLRTYKRLPILNGFRFMPSDIVKDPFVNTSFKVNAGTGVAIDLKNYIKNKNGNIIDTASGDLTYVQGVDDFQYALNDWLAFSASYGGYGRLGSNTYTILSQGVSYTVGYNLGSTVRLVNKEKFVLSGAVDYSSTKISMYDMYGFIKGAIQNIGDSTFKDSLLIEDNVHKLFFNANVAYAPYNWLGILGNAGFGLGKAFQQKERGNIRLGIAGSVDFLNVKHINFPIGVLVSFRYSAFSQSGENADNVFNFGFRLSYTGHKDFDIGIESIYSKINYKKTDEPVKAIQTAVKVGYYF